MSSRARKLIPGLAVLAALTAVSSAGADALQPATTHWCRAGDPPLQVSQRTSCGVAGDVIDSLFNSPALTPDRTRTVSVSSPVTGRSYRLRLVCSGDHVVATGSGGIWIRFYYTG